MLNLECILVSTKDTRDSTLKEWQAKIHSTGLIHLLEGKFTLLKSLSLIIELCIHLIMELQGLIWCSLDLWATTHHIIITWVHLKVCRLIWVWLHQAVVGTWVVLPTIKWCNPNNSSSRPKEQEINLLSPLISRTWLRKFQARTIWTLK